MKFYKLSDSTNTFFLNPVNINSFYIVPSSSGSGFDIAVDCGSITPGVIAETGFPSQAAAEARVLALVKLYFSGPSIL